MAAAMHGEHRPLLSEVTPGDSGAKMTFWTLVLVAANTMNGPGIVALPAAYHASGFKTATLVLAGAALLTAATVSVFVDLLRAARDRCPNVELCGLARKRGKEMYWVTLGLLSTGIVMLSCAQIVVTSQIIDAVVVSVFGSSWAFALYPSPSFVATSAGALLPFPPGTFGLSVGFLLNAGVCIYFAQFDISGNLTPQYVSSGLSLYFLAGLAAYVLSTTAGPAPEPVAYSYTELCGVAIFNFAFVVAVPSLFTDTRKYVNFKAALFVAIAVVFVFGVLVGTLGSRLPQPAGNVLATVFDRHPGLLTKTTVFSYAVALALPIPVYLILLRRNLEAAFSGRWAAVVATGLPWGLACLFYMQPWFSSLVNWSSLVCLGFINYSIPLSLVVDARRFDAYVPAKERAIAFTCFLVTGCVIIVALAVNLFQLVF
ncbi:hypothetical protein DIPPA_03288 [Diplonema papillatum]|nr:hypothetical protein DIPPA_03288 [Diplonema papillatum]